MPGLRARKPQVGEKKTRILCTAVKRLEHGMKVVDRVFEKDLVE